MSKDSKTGIGTQPEAEGRQLQVHQPGNQAAIAAAARARWSVTGPNIGKI